MVRLKITLLLSHLRVAAFRRREGKEGNKILFSNWLVARYTLGATQHMSFGGLLKLAPLGEFTGRLSRDLPSLT